MSCSSRMLEFFGRRTWLVVIFRYWNQVLEFFILEIDQSHSLQLVCMFKVENLKNCMCLIDMTCPGCAASLVVFLGEQGFKHVWHRACCRLCSRKRIVSSLITCPNQVVSPQHYKYSFVSVIFSVLLSNPNLSHSNSSKIHLSF